MKIKIDSSVKHKNRLNLNGGGWFDVIDIDPLRKIALCIYEDEQGNPYQETFTFEELKLNPIQPVSKPSIFYPESQKRSVKA